MNRISRYGTGSHCTMPTKDLRAFGWDNEDVIVEVGKNEIIIKRLRIKR